MPQASDELRDLMEKYFGDPISETGPLAYLESKGYREEGNGFITPPAGFVEFDDSREKEWHCVMFLIHEWDFDLNWRPRNG